MYLWFPYCYAQHYDLLTHTCCQYTVRLEFWRDGINHIQTLLVCPGAVSTGMFNGIWEGAHWTNMLGRLVVSFATPETVADAILQSVQTGDKLLISCARGWRQAVLSWLPALARLLPVSYCDLAMYLGGGVYGMETFRGHDHSKSSNHQ